MVDWKNQLLNCLKVVLILGAFSNAGPLLRAQTARPDDPVPSTTVNKPRTNNKPIRSKHEAKTTPGNVKPRFSSIKLLVIPADSAVWIDGQQIDKVDPTGRFELNIEPGPHRLIVRHAGYSDQLQTLSLTPGESDLGTITLEPRLGRLNVAPETSGATITIENSDSQHIGTYAGAVSDLRLAEGDYKVIVSKTGYATKTLEVNVRAGETFHFDPSLEPLEAKAPLPLARSNFRVPVRSSVRTEGKFLIVELEGASGDNTGILGSINFTVSDPASGIGQTDGALSGGPCQVEFIRLENVAEGSFIETPGPSNRWARLVLRIRPKNSKRPLQFVINWKSVQPGKG
jgi:hypothetical protein